MATITTKFFFFIRGDSRGKEGSTPECDPGGQPGAWHQHLPEEDKQRSWESREERRRKQWPSRQMLKAHVPALLTHGQRENCKEQAAGEASLMSTPSLSDLTRTSQLVKLKQCMNYNNEGDGDRSNNQTAVTLRPLSLKSKHQKTCWPSYLGQL